MSRKILQVFLLLCLSVLAAANLGLAQEKTDADVIAQLQRDGWKILGDGVLQRELRPGEVEHFVFGVKGFIWKLQDLRAQYVVLQAKYRAHPTAELKRTIANHRQEIDNTMRMIRRARAAEKLGLADDLKVDCSLSFGYNATAGYRTDVQGVWATGTANFSATGPCGFTGEVYAYATGTVTRNGGPYTESVTDGPRSGASVTARAAVSISGGSPCDSYAYGSMTSYSLNPSSYSMAASNSSCPVPDPPPVVVITGPTYIDLNAVYCKTVTWSSSVSGGTAPITYSWTVNGYQMGTGSSFSLYVCQGDYTYDGGFTLGVKVTDSKARWDTDSRWISVYEPTCTDPCICSSPSKAPEIIPCASPQ